MQVSCHDFKLEGGMNGKSLYGLRKASPYEVSIYVETRIA